MNHGTFSDILTLYLLFETEHKDKQQKTLTTYPVTKFKLTTFINKYGQYRKKAKEETISI